MRREDHVREAEQRFGRLGFSLVDVQRGAGEGAGGERLGQRGGVDQAAAGDVDHVALRAQRLQHLGVDDVPGRRAARRGDDQEVRPLRQLDWRAEVAAARRIAALAAIGSVALARTVAPSFTRATILNDLAVVFVVGLPLYLVSAVGHYLALAVEASHEAERRAFETEVTAREAELRALRAQLNPHFLFNSLNSINALIGSDPEGARRMCERLGDFLRRSLALGAREVVTLGEELILVERYLDIEQLRFGARLRVEVEVADVLRECLVPPLLLQPLVENAIKHGIQDLVEGGVVRLEAHGEGERLSITVTNPIDGDAPLRTGEGVGLANVQRRLVAWGEEAASLRADRTVDHFRVALTLPLRRREEAHR